MSYIRQKATSSRPIIWEGIDGTPGSERARHVTKGNKASVGDPNSSLYEVSINECKNEEIEMTGRDSDES